MRHQASETHANSQLPVSQLGCRDFISKFCFHIVDGRYIFLVVKQRFCFAAIALTESDGGEMKNQREMREEQQQQQQQRWKIGFLRENELKLNWIGQIELAFAQH